jgi:hypothetical protein
VPDKASFVHAFYAPANNRDLFVDDFEPVADRAMAYEAAADRVLQVRQHGFDIDDAGGEEDGARLDMLGAAARDKAAGIRAVELVDMAGREHRAVAARLLAQLRQKLAPADALGKSGIIVGRRNERSAARAGIDHADVAAKTGKINRCRQARGAAADDETIEHQRVLRRGARALNPGVRRRSDRKSIMKRR